MKQMYERSFDTIFSDCLAKNCRLMQLLPLRSINYNKSCV